MKTLLTLFKTNHNLSPLIARLILGLVMFPHGAQKALGWFGGYGFNGTMQFFTGQMHLPALFAFLAIAAEFAGSIGLITGFLSRVSASGIAVVMVVFSVIARVFGCCGNYRHQDTCVVNHRDDVFGLPARPE